MGQLEISRPLQDVGDIGSILYGRCGRHVCNGAMTTWIISTIGAIIAGCAVHYGQAYMSKYINHLKKMRSLARVKQEPYYKVGSKVVKAISPGSGSIICMNYEIIEMGVGRILLQSKDGKHLLPMTCMEFEELHVIIENEERGTN